MALRSTVFLFISIMAAATLVAQKPPSPSEREAVIAEALSLAESAALEDRLHDWPLAILASVLSRSNGPEPADQIRLLADLQERVARAETGQRRLSGASEHRKILVELARVDAESALDRWEARPEIPDAYRSLSEGQFERALLVMVAEGAPETILAHYRRPNVEIDPAAIQQAVITAHQRDDPQLAHELIDRAYESFATAAFTEQTLLHLKSMISRLAQLGFDERRSQGIDLLLERFPEFVTDKVYTVTTDDAQVELTAIEFHVLQLGLAGLEPDLETIRRVPTLEARIEQLGGWEAAQGHLVFLTDRGDRISRVGATGGRAAHEKRLARIRSGPEAIKAAVEEAIADPTTLGNLLSTAGSQQDLSEAVEKAAWEAVEKIGDPERKALLIEPLLRRSRDPVTPEVMNHWTTGAEQLEVDEERLRFRAPRLAWRVTLLRRWARTDWTAALEWVRENTVDPKLRFHSLVTLLQTWPEDRVAQQ